MLGIEDAHSDSQFSSQIQPFVQIKRYMVYSNLWSKKHRDEKNNYSH
jgi:hypothetical protein